MDFALALLPWKILWGVQMRTVEKLGVCFAMSLGFLYVFFFYKIFVFADKKRLTPSLVLVQQPLLGASISSNLQPKISPVSRIS